MRFRTFIIAMAAGTSLTSSAQIKSTNMPIVRITMEDVVTQALQNNFRIAIQRQSRYAAALSLRGSYAIYDPTFSFTFNHSSTTSEGQFNQFGFQSPNSQSTRDSVANTIGGYAPSGLNYEVGLSFDHRTGTSGGGPFDQYGSSLGFTRLSQPLLRDFWIDSRRLTIQVAKLDRNVADLDFEAQVQSIVSQVQKAYFDLVKADEDIKVALSSHELAAQLARDIHRKVEVGEMAPLESKQAESQAQTQLSIYYQSLHTRNTIENRIKSLITQKYQKQYESRLQPAEKLLALERHPVDLQESWKNGLAKRPDYRAAFFAVEKGRLNARFTKNQLFPTLNATGGYTRSGLDSTSISTNGSSYADLGGAFNDFRRNSAPSYNVGMVLSTPLTLRKERMDNKRAKLSHEQTILLLEELEQKILVDIDDTVSLIKSSYLRVQTTRAAREFAEEALSAEQKKLEKGVSTPSEVLRRQDDLTRARSEELKALLDYNKALVDLDLNDGTILERNKVQLEGVSTK